MTLTGTTGTTPCSRPLEANVKVRSLVCTLLLFVLLIPTTAQAYTRHDHRIRNLISRSLHAKGIGRADRLAALVLARRESGYDETQITGTCYGLFQLQTSAPRSKWSRPGWNIWKANRYVRHRYGTWRAALAHSYSRGWY